MGAGLNTIGDGCRGVFWFGLCYVCMYVCDDGDVFHFRLGGRWGAEGWGLEGLCGVCIVIVGSSCIVCINMMR